MAVQPTTGQIEREARKQADLTNPQPNHITPETAQDTITPEPIPDQGGTITILPTKDPRGAPTNFTEDIAAELCARIAEGESIRHICLQDGIPALRTVMEWLVKIPTFTQRYALARELQADTLADDILYIADTATDFRLAALRIDARKWIASKLKPKKYGDIRHLDVQGGIDLNITPVRKGAGAGAAIEHKTDGVPKAIGP